MEMSITAEQIQMQGSVSFQKITGLKVMIKANEHGKAYIRGIVDQEIAKKNWLKLDNTSWIQLMVSSEQSKQSVCLFYGYIDKVKVMEQKEFYEMELELSSGTRQWDINRNKRSFQDQNATYKQIIEKIIKEKKKAFYGIVRF